MTTFCSKCLSPNTHFIKNRVDRDGRTYKLYSCSACKNYTRDFSLTERETVDEAIAEESQLAFSANGVSAKPEQLTLFEIAKPLRYGD